MIDGLDRVAANMERRSGRRTYRGDVVRLAIESYLERHLPVAEF